MSSSKTVTVVLATAVVVLLFDKVVTPSPVVPLPAVLPPAVPIAAPQVAPATAPPKGEVRPLLCEVHEKDRIVVSKREIMAAHNPDTYSRYLPYCCNPKPVEDDWYRKFLFAEPGKEHYSILGWFARKFGEAGGAVLVEVGSREGASSLVLASDERNSLYSFDVMSTADHIAQVMATRNMAENPTRLTVQQHLQNIHYIQSNVTDVTKPFTSRYRSILLASQLILLDTLHEPETHPFEYGFLEFLDKNNYSGVILLDDIYLNDEMKRFWQFLVKKYGSHRAIDITAVGHGSGTGLLDFCGNTIVDLS